MCRIVEWSARQNTGGKYFIGPKTTVVLVYLYIRDLRVAILGKSGVHALEVSILLLRNVTGGNLVISVISCSVWKLCVT